MRRPSGKQARKLKRASAGISFEKGGKASRRTSDFANQKEPPLRIGPEKKRLAAFLNLTGCNLPVDAWSGRLVGGGRRRKNPWRGEKRKRKRRY